MKAGLVAVAIALTVLSSMPSGVSGQAPSGNAGGAVQQAEEGFCNWFCLQIFIQDIPEPFGYQCTNYGYPIHGHTHGLWCIATTEFCFVNNWDCGSSLAILNDAGLPLRIGAACEALDRQVTVTNT
jgi:hypothetical protein